VIVFEDVLVPVNVCVPVRVLEDVTLAVLEDVEVCVDVDVAVKVVEEVTLDVAVFV